VWAEATYFRINYPVTGINKAIIHATQTNNTFISLRKKEYLCLSVLLDKELQKSLSHLGQEMWSVE
jgi:hypothetical protein